MMSKILVTALLVVCGLGADTQGEHDELTLLQRNAEVKKNEAAKMKRAAEDAEEAAAGRGYPSPCSTCQQGEIVGSQPQPSVMKEVEAPSSAFLPLGTILQALAILLIGDVMRRAPWKASTKAETQVASKAAAPADSQAAMLAAALNGDEAAFEAEIDNNLSQLSRVDSWGCTVMHYAAKGGSAPIVQKLVDVGAAVEALDAWDETPLHLAARAGRIEVCDILINGGASIDAMNAEECTPLIVAGRGDHEAICRLLISHGANVASVEHSMVPELVAAILKEQEAPLG